MNRPAINVTPLIDVLLVLLIIFMVISPLKPTKFEARIPQKPSHTEKSSFDPLTLVVAVEPDYSLKLNNENLSTIDNAASLVEKLRTIFKEREENGTFSPEGKIDDNTLTAFEKTEKTVFIKASRQTDYGSVAKVIDAVKLSGANPISLQIDDLQ